MACLLLAFVRPASVTDDLESQGIAFMTADAALGYLNALTRPTCRVDQHLCRTSAQVAEATLDIASTSPKPLASMECLSVSWRDTAVVF